MGATDVRRAKAIPVHGQGQVQLVIELNDCSEILVVRFVGVTVRLLLD